MALCPDCSEEIAEGIERCPECGAVLVEVEPSARRGLPVIAVLSIGCALVVLLLGAVVVVPIYLRMRRSRTRATGSRCANDLRQLGLAAIQYADDKRFFPQVGPIGELDGDVETSDTPRKVRALVWYFAHPQTAAPPQPAGAPALVVAGATVDDPLEAS